jgi:hypothetical protein
MEARMPSSDPNDIANPAKTRMASGDVALGMIVRLARSGDIARIAKTTGHDFIFIDRQHSLFSLETVGHIAQAALGCGVAPLVRARSCDDPDVSVILDNGATGIIFPDVNSADDARRAVNACKFAPLGKRSVAGGYPQLDLRPVPIGWRTSARSRPFPASMSCTSAATTSSPRWASRARSAIRRSWPRSSA